MKYDENEDYEETEGEEEEYNDPEPGEEKEPEQVQLEPLTTREQNVLQTLTEMFQQRGYQKIKFEDELTAINEGETVTANPRIFSKLNTEVIKGVVLNFEVKMYSHAILVYEGVPTANVKKQIDELSKIGKTIEIFSADDLQLNITKHILVPKHELLKISKFKDKINLPIILRSDPICRFYNFPKGEVIKVTRRDGFIAYRIVR